MRRRVFTPLQSRQMQLRLNRSLKVPLRLFEGLKLPVSRPRKPPTHLEICRRRARPQFPGLNLNTRIQQVN
ncbi:hypothetical protein ABVT39_006666 [Epinephelus coioides]